MIDDDTKFGIKMSLFIFLLAGAVVVFIAWLGGLFSENEVQPPPVEAPATTAREEIVTGVCTFGDCPIATTIATEIATEAIKKQLRNNNPTNQPENLTNAETVEYQGSTDNEPTETPSTSQNDKSTYQSGYIGMFYITGYTAEEGFPEGSATASGYGVRPGYCAMNAEQRRSLGISYGDYIYVEGLGTYTVMDCGCGWGVVDIWVYSNAEAYSITGSYNVYSV